MNNQRRHKTALEWYRSKAQGSIIDLLVVLICIAVLIGYAISASQSYFEYTEEDVRMLGDIMYAEVGGLYATETHKDVKRAHMLTGSVVLHRLESRLFGETMKQVIRASGQYDMDTLQAMGNINTPGEVYKWAEELLRKGPKGPKGLIFEASYEQGTKTYWKIDGKIYFGVVNNIPIRVKGGKVN